MGSLFSHALRGLVVRIVGLVVAAPVTGREVGLWKEIIDCVEKESPD